MEKIIQRMAEATLRWLYEEDTCPVCQNLWEGLCPACQAKLLPWGEIQGLCLNGQALYAYTGPGRKLLYRYKVHGSFAAEKALIELFQKLDPEDFKHYDVLVPIPSARRNIQKRGMNCSTRLGKGLAKALHLPLGCYLTNQGREEQKQKDIQGRQSQAQMSLRIQRDLNLKDQNVLLFDDVITTGASVETAARLLKERGARCVDFFVLFHPLKE